MLGIQNQTYHPFWFTVVQTTAKNGYAKVRTSASQPPIGRRTDVTEIKQSPNLGGSARSSTEIGRKHRRTEAKRERQSSSRHKSLICLQITINASEYVNAIKLTSPIDEFWITCNKFKHVSKSAHTSTYQRLLTCLAA